MSTTVKLNTCPKCNAPIPAEAPQGLCPKCVLLRAATATEQGVSATATSEIPTIERIAAAFPQLEVLELIGRGGMGFVFKARQPHLDRFVALKLLPDKLARDAQFAERFNREGRVLAKLNHPNIVSVFDFGQTGGFYYLLMEYVDGVNLRQAMKAGGFSPDEALAIVPKVCEALQYAHEQGVLHRDIKPENILLDDKGRVKIADFGIAKLVGEEQPSITLTNTGAALGTPHYMAPEQLEKPSTVDHRADIYSLGVVFYEMLTGELPIGRFAPPSSKTPVNASVDEIVFRTLEKDRERRFQSAGEMKTRVEHVTEAVESPAPDGQEVVPDVSLVKRPAQGLVAVGILNWIGSIIVMLVLTYLGLGPGFPFSPQELGFVGLLMIAFSSVILLSGLKMMRLQAYPLTLLGSVLAMITTPGNIIGLPVGLWALVTLRQPKVRAAFALSAVRETGPPASGVWRWVFGTVLAVVAGFIVVPDLVHRRQPVAPPLAPVLAGVLTDTNPAVEATPMLQFTCTAVAVREEEDARWLAMDYVEQIRGDCERTFRYNANVPGFTAQTRTTSFMTDAKAGFPPVLHHRVSWKLPESLSRAEALALRDLVEKERVGKPISVQPAEEYPLFKTVVSSGGSLVAAVGAVRTTEKTRASPPENQDEAAGEKPEAAQRNMADGVIRRETLMETERQLDGFERSTITTSAMKAITRPVPAVPANRVGAQASTPNLLVNAGAETGNLFGWSTNNSPPSISSLLKPVDRLAGLPPRTGSFAFHGTLGQSWMSQTHSLLGRLGIAAAQIDKGTLYANASFWTISDNSGDAARLILTFLDVGNRVVSTFAGPFISFPNPRYPTHPAFTNYQASVPVPPGTRAISYSIHFKNAQNGKHLASLVDDCSLTISSVPLTNAVLHRSVAKP